MVLSQRELPGNHQIPQQAPCPEQQNRVLWPPWLGHCALSGRKISKMAVLAQGAGQQVLPTPWPLRAKVLFQHVATLPSRCPARPQHRGKEKREEPDPAARKGDVLALLSELSGEHRNPGLLHHLRKACSQVTEEGALLLLFPLQAPESIVIQ